MKKALRRIAAALLAGLLCFSARAEQPVDRCESLSQARARIAACVAEEGERLYLPCAPEVYQELMAENAALLYAILGCSGMLDYQLTCLDSASALALNRIAYYPGLRLAHAALRGEEERLTERERAALSAARGLAVQAAGDTAAETVRAVHDLLAERIAYAKSPSAGRYSENDTALGALLAGRADCDGYADAFYLTATLAGLQAEYQYGQGNGPTGATAHQWNRVLLEGEWYFLDCCWAREELPAGGAQARQIWFLLGEKEATAFYQWDARAHEQPLTERAYPAR